MAKIYGQANQVIVYLGKAADDSDAALECIRSAAEDEEETKSLSFGKEDEEPVLKLLERPWFQRIWVLQEVALARSILIMCGAVEMDAYTFCSGINKLELSLENYSDLLSLIRPTMYMIRGSLFRPRYTPRLLGDLTIGELINMYHAHNTTIRHDKIYALLSMSSYGFSSVDLLPDYKVSWKMLFRRLIKFILSEETSVETWDNRETAVIQSRGYTISHVSSIDVDSHRYHRQHIVVDFNKTPIASEYYSYYGTEWTLLPTANNIQKDDLICFLEGASQPSIIRPCNDHFAVIVIAFTPGRRIEIDKRNDILTFDLPDDSLHDFLLAWQWGSFPALNRPIRDREIEINSVLPGYLKNDAHKALKSFDVAMILKSAGNLREASFKLQTDIRKQERVFGRENRQILKSKESLVSIDMRLERWPEVEKTLFEVIDIRQNLQGVYHRDTLNAKAELAKFLLEQMYDYCSNLKGSERWKKKDLDELMAELMVELPEAIRNNKQIEEQIIIKTLNMHCREETMFKLLLGLERNFSITDKMVKATSQRFAIGDLIDVFAVEGKSEWRSFRRVDKFDYESEREGYYAYGEEFWELLTPTWLKEYDDIMRGNATGYDIFCKERV